jgi:hypothetical protein
VCTCGELAINGQGASRTQPVQQSLFALQCCAGGLLAVRPTYSRGVTLMHVPPGMAEELKCWCCCCTLSDVQGYVRS